MTRQVAAVSVGIVRGRVQLDLAYKEDSEAEVDMNVVMDDHGNLIEVQATGEEHVFSRKQHDRLLDMADRGIKDLMRKQMESLNSRKNLRLIRISNKVRHSLNHSSNFSLVIPIPGVAQIRLFSSPFSYSITTGTNSIPFSIQFGLESSSSISSRPSGRRLL
jgi:hypothetical protein